MTLEALSDGSSFQLMSTALRILTTRVVLSTTLPFVAPLVCCFD